MLHGLVGEPHVQRVAVGGRVDGDSLDPELVQRPDHAHRDLAAVRDQHAREHRHQIPSGRPFERLELEQQLPVLDRLGVRRRGSCGRSPSISALTGFISFIASRMQSVWPCGDGVALLDERRLVLAGRAVEGADHRALDAAEARRRAARDRRLVELARRGGVRRRDRGDRRPLGRAADAHAHAVLLDRDLVDAGLLHDLARPRGSAPRGSARGPARRASPPRSRARGSTAAAARPRRRTARAAAAPPRSTASPFALVAERVEVDLLLGGGSPRRLTARCERRVDRPGRVAEAAADQVAQLVDDRPVAVRAEHVDERLRGDDVAHRRGERRRAGLDADAVDLVEHLVEPAAGVARAQLDVGGRDERDRDLPPRGAHGDPRQQRRRGRVAEVLVDEVGGLPEHVLVDARVEPEPGERLRGRLGRDAVRGERDGIDGAGDQVGAAARRLERERERVPPGALAVEADGQARELVQLGDELARACGLQQAGRIVRAGRARRRSPAAASRPRRARRGGGCRRAAPRRTRARRRGSPRPRRAGSRRRSAGRAGGRRRCRSRPPSRRTAARRRRRRGRAPTRKRPRTASASGVFVCALSARIRSHGLSTPRRTAASNAPPPETSR